MSGGVVGPNSVFDASFTEDMPGMWCSNHRSVYCVDAQAMLQDRADAPQIAGHIERSLVNGRMRGEPFFISVPIFPKLCIWEVHAYVPAFHATMGPLAELHEKDMEVRPEIGQLLVGEGAADVAFTLRREFEDNHLDKIEAIRDTHPAVKPKLPRCANSQHSVKYQDLVREILDPTRLREDWDVVIELAMATMFCFTSYKQCPFCWAKKNMSDAIRVSPDFPGDAAPEGTTNFDDLIPV